MLFQSKPDVFSNSWVTIAERVVEEFEIKRITYSPFAKLLRTFAETLDHRYMGVVRSLSLDGRKRFLLFIRYEMLKSSPDIARKKFWKCVVHLISYIGEVDLNVRAAEVTLELIQEEKTMIIKKSGELLAATLKTIDRPSDEKDLRVYLQLVSEMLRKACLT